ncbi:MAG: tetratricopeptide repeat protein [Candidatus Rifleibacteriota bacterium]
MNKLNRKRLVYLFFLWLIGLVSLHAQSEQAAPLVKKAKDHLNLFHYDQARSMLKQAIQMDPENWEAYFLIGRSFIKQKNDVEAEKYLSKAHSLNSSELDCQKALGAVYINLAKTAQANGKPDEMTELLHKACRAYPGGTKIWQTLFENWWKAGQYDKIAAEGDFLAKENKRLLEQGDDKNLQQALVIVAKTYFQKGDFPSADKYLKLARMIRQTNDELYEMQREIKAKSEENAKSLIDTAQKEADAGNFDKALEILAQAEKTSSASDIQDMIDKIQKEAGVQKFLTAADELRKANKQEEALEKLEEASMQFPEDERIANLLAVVSKSVEKIHNEQAEKNAQLIAQKRKKLEQAQQYRFFVKEGQASEKNKQFDMAIINFEKALAINPASEDLKKKIASLKVEAENFKARQNAFALARGDFEALFTTEKLGDAYEKGKQIEADYEEGKAEIAPIMAEVCLKLEKLDEAKEFAIVFENDSEQKDLYNYILGMVAYQQGNNDQAMEYLKKIETDNFRSNISGTIRSIYLYKYQVGLYIVGLIILFPLIRFIKESLANMRRSSMLRRIESIRESGAYEANIDFLEERFAKDDVPNPKQIAVMLAEALLRKGNAQRCYEIVSGVLKKDVKNLHAKRLAGEACLKLEDSSPTGMDHIQNLFKLDETRKDVIDFLAKTFIRQQSDHKLAQDFIVKYIALNPSDSDALAFLADTIIKRQAYSQQSIKVFERIIKIAPDVPDYYAALITNFRKLDNHDEARKIAEIARSKFPDAAEFLDSRPAPGIAGKIGLKPSSPAGGFPDYENIGQPAANTGGFPDYENIGTPAASGGFPDYENIGSPGDGGLNYENIGNEPTQPVKVEPASAPSISGPCKICPNCQAANSIKEYYCSACGRPL